jgi:uncharacterized tellurite resistance protein B-like protein
VNPLSWLKGTLSSIESEPELPDVRVAACAMLYEVARADGQFQKDELSALQQKLIARWQISAQEAENILAAGKEMSENSVDFHPMLETLRESWGQSERIALIHDMWTIAHADGHIDSYEEHIIRRVAELLHVAHSEFIRGKLQQSG